METIERTFVTYRYNVAAVKMENGKATVGEIRTFDVDEQLSDRAIKKQLKAGECVLGVEKVETLRRANVDDFLKISWVVDKAKEEAERAAKRAAKAAQNQSK